MFAATAYVLALTAAAAAALQTTPVFLAINLQIIKILIKNNNKRRKKNDREREKR